MNLLMTRTGVNEMWGNNFLARPPRVFWGGQKISSSYRNLPLMSSLSFLILVAGCSFPMSSYDTHEVGEPLDHVKSAGEVAWVWEPPDGERPYLRGTSEGVIVLLENGVFGLSGETGEELWSYYEPDQEFLVEVTDNGEFVVLQEEDNSRTILLESDTGRVVNEFTLDLSEIDHMYRVQVGNLFEPLSTITGNSWTLRWEDTVFSLELETGDEAWKVQDLSRCSGQGSVDDIDVRGDAVVAATTCQEEPEGETPAQSFTSELVGLDGETGEELWRVEHSIGRRYQDSLERTIESRPGGLVYIDFNYPYRPLGYSLLDIEAREATHLELQNLLWVSPDGSRLGLWDTETGAYLVRDRSGANERTLEPETKAEGVRVGLEGGVLYLNEWTEDASASEGFGWFDGFDGDSTFVWDKAEELSVHEALDVPGAVAVSYTADGEPGVMGLR